MLSEANRAGSITELGDSVPEPLGFIALGPECLAYTGDTRTEDKAPQGCDLSADSSAGMTRDGFDAEVVPDQNQTRRTLAYCWRKMVLTTGSTIVPRWENDLRLDRRPASSIVSDPQLSSRKRFS